MAEAVVRAAPERLTLIRPGRGWVGLGLKDLWEHRELLAVLAARDIKVRYKQTLLGAGWAVLQPLGLALVFCIIFGKVAKIPTDNLPYAVLAFSGLMPWVYFARGLSGAAGSVVENRVLITKVYFPRLVLPLAPLLSGLVDLGLSLLIFGAMLLWYGIAPGTAVLALPAFVLLALLSAFSLGLWMSALNAYYRDFRYVIAFALQLGLYASPVAYPASLIPSSWRLAYGLNPMASVIEGFRWSLLGRRPPWDMLWVSVGVVLVLTATGMAFFRRMERNLVDVV